MFSHLLQTISFGPPTHIPSSSSPPPNLAIAHLSYQHPILLASKHDDPQYVPVTTTTTTTLIPTLPHTLDTSTSATLLSPTSALGIAQQQQQQQENIKPLPMTRPSQFHPPWYYQLTAGAIAGGTAAIVVSPLDVARIRIQIAPPGEHHGLFGINVIKNMVEKEGFRSLISGLPTNMLALVPNWMSYFLAYSQFRSTTIDHLLPLIGPTSFDIINALFAGVVSTFCTHPLWLVKARFQVQGLKSQYGDSPPKTTHLTGFVPPTIVQDPSTTTATTTTTTTTSSKSTIQSVAANGANNLNHNNNNNNNHHHHPSRGHMYKGTVDALIKIGKSEGIKGLYNGFSSQLLGLIHVGLHFPLYEKLKRELYLYNCRNNKSNDENNLNDDDDETSQQHKLSTLNLLDPSLPNHLSAWQIVLASMTSKITASTLAYPHEVLRSRFQTQDFLQHDQYLASHSKNATTSTPNTSSSPNTNSNAYTTNNTNRSNNTNNSASTNTSTATNTNTTTTKPTNRIRYTSIPQALREIVKTEGFAGLYRGLDVTLIRSVPACIVTFLMYEETMLLLKKYGTSYPTFLASQADEKKRQRDII